ncbi:MAG TPA: hypothetical protein VKU01_16205 [Bryobacteraceae bacterium]|nr:hypothetical protein [Bryobacteraceae bacterium]
MKLLSLLGKPDGSAPNYQSTLRVAAESIAGVRFTISRMSFGRRLELGRRIRELAKRMEFHESGGGVQEKLEAGVLACEVDRIYLEWGLLGIENLIIDDEPATVESLLDRGPEALCREIVAAIKAQCGLSEEERKN